jgi:hypothetical protein
MEIVRDIFTLESISMYTNEVFGRLGPRRQLNMVDGRAGTLDTKIKLVSVHQKLGKAKKLGNEFFDISCTLEAIFPRLGDGTEETIRPVKLSALQTDELRGPWLHSDQIEQHRSSARIMATIMEGWDGVVDPIFVSILVNVLLATNPQRKFDFELVRQTS